MTVSNREFSYIAISDVDENAKTKIDNPPAGDVVRIDVDKPNSADMKNTSLSLDSKIIKHLNNPEEFKGVSAQTRTDIIQTVEAELGFLADDHAANDIGTALCRLFLENDVLRRQIKKSGPGDDNIFNISNFDKVYRDAMCTDRVCSGNPEIDALACSVAVSSFFTIRPLVKTYHSRESSTTKLLKVFFPIGLAALVFYELYDHFKQPFGNFLARDDDRYNATNPDYNETLSTYQIGAVLVPLFFAWIACCISANMAAMKECAPEDAKDNSDITEQEIKQYIKNHEVNSIVFTAVKESNIEGMLTTWHKPERGDNPEAVRGFARELLSEWVKALRNKPAHQPLIDDQKININNNRL